MSANRGGANTDFRHKNILFGTTPSFKNISLSARYVGHSGTPWSPLVLSDIVSVGAGLLFNANKRAFVFNPETIRANPNRTPFENIIADGMDGVLSNPNNIARKLLMDNLDQIASKDVCFPYLFSQDD